MSWVLLSYAFPPLSYPRAIQVARLVKHMRAEPLHVVAATEERRSDPSLLASVDVAHATVERLPWPPRARALRLARRVTLRDRWLVPDAYGPWAAAAGRRLLSRGFAPGEVLVTFGEPMSDHLAGLAVRRGTGVPWVAHFSDPWSDSPYRRGGRAARALNRRRERAVIEAADLVVFTAGTAAEVAMAKYPKGLQGKARVVPHAFDPELYPPRSAPRDDGVLVARYVGTFYGQRQPDPLLDGLARLRGQDPRLLAGLRVELVGAHQPAHRGLAGRVHAADALVTSCPAVGYVESLRLMREANLLILVDAPGESSLFLPSKLVDYLGAGRPIVGITPPGPAADLVRRAGGWVAAPGDGEAVAAALREAIVAARSQREPEWGDPAVRSGYEAAAVATKMEALIREVAQARES